MLENEFEVLISDDTKAITSEIKWTVDDDHPTWVEFRVPVESGASYPLFVKGSLNCEAEKVSFVLVHKSFGRIYGLCLGHEHRNPDQTTVGEKHKHRWKDPPICDKWAYVPDDITATVRDPLGLWSQFCAEAKIKHNGHMLKPLGIDQRKLFE